MPRFKPTTRILTGQEDLDRRLQLLALAPANRAARAGLLKGSRLAAKLIKKEIPSRYKGARAAIGASVKQTKGGITKAKAGARVGKRKAARKPIKRSSRGGEGIGIANVHWLLLGTEDRTQWKTTGRPTGAMPQLEAVKRAMANKTQVIAAIREGTSKQFLKELQKLARKRAAERRKAARLAAGK